MISWFEHHVQNALKENDSPDAHLKYDHSHRVAKNCRWIAEKLRWPESDLRLGEAVGLFHDIGRFLQLKKHGSMDDQTTQDHGELGWKILDQDSTLPALDQQTREQLFAAVRYHNRRHLPAGLEPEQSRFLHLVRDSDKLDIYTVFSTEMRRDRGAAITRLWPRLQPDHGKLNPALLEEYLTNRDCSYNNVLTLTDFSLVLLSWVYAFNYQPSYTFLAEQGNLEEVIQFFPSNPDLQRLADEARAYVTERANAACHLS